MSPPTVSNFSCLSFVFLRDNNSLLLEKIEALYTETLPWYSASVSGGASVYLERFFPDDGFFKLYKDENVDLDIEEKEAQKE